MGVRADVPVHVVGRELSAVSYQLRAVAGRRGHRFRLGERGVRPSRASGRTEDGAAGVRGDVSVRAVGALAVSCQASARGFRPGDLSG